MSGAREAVLARVRAALGPAPAVPEIPRAYRGVGASADFDAIDRFCERVADYRANVQRVVRGELPRALMAACAQREARRIAVPADAPAWTVDGVELVRDDPPLSYRRLDALDGVLSGCALAIAQTGTIVLDAGRGMGRRALTLLPDYHLCVVKHDQIVASVPEAIATLQSRPTRPITFISGPSATVDIEMTRVRGVHGPRNLEVIVVKDLDSPSCAPR
jgi:L-lactate dehydrogenase complex protein LldG